MLLLPQSLAGEPDVEAMAAKPQEDGLGCRHLSCKSSAFGHKATSSLLIKKALTTCSLLAGSLLVFLGGTLVKEAMVVSGLLFVVSSLLVKMVLASHRLEATALILPKGINCPLPILVGVPQRREPHGMAPLGGFGGSSPAACWSSRRV